METVERERRELDHRMGDGFEVRLLWGADDGELTVVVDDGGPTSTSRSGPAPTTRSKSSNIRSHTVRRNLAQHGGALRAVGDSLST